MLMFKIIGLLMLITASTAAPLASVHVKFISPPHIYEHQLTTDGQNTITQKSFLSIGQRSADFGNKLSSRFLKSPRALTASSFGARNPEALWPNGVFVAPVDVNDLGFSSQESSHLTPDFTNGLAYPDPLLLTDEAAVSAIRHLYGRTGLFFHEIPHLRSLLRLQQERRLNGLDDNVLGSLRPGSPFYNSRA
ncbi:uncharacterized protein LOC103575779 isoform X2 [Microplitis demolitor]|uniref:uncharacterized protein LOC103575779 isoform X2 n=1 Tax=Microplitis demolitor TaxID=69319 RepID=UPI0004CD32A5|nr:uncharacterized protein LOC103575779 isoform X2 [Microplitis demolitor]